MVEALKARRPELTVVVTGRNAKPELIAAADCVTEMGAVKHHFAAGFKAQEGIEFLEWDRKSAKRFSEKDARQNKNLEPLSIHRTRISSKREKP